ncbi:MAG TPA: nucleoside monophosphate kinase [Candidatus Saccharimonadales bacterium]|nr:nucleoside monophosphate kinase [Candidatus Saccharimonadales bacterium]
MILLFGPPGAGKSMQGQLLAAHNNWRWLSVGQLLRDAHDKEANVQMQEGKGVDYKTVYRILIEALNKSKSVEHVIIDGFPRDLEQAEWLLAALPDHNRSIQAAIILNVPLEESQRRLKVRGRFDDERDVVEKRYYEFEGRNGSIIDYLKSRHVPVVEINGSGSPEEVHHVINEELKRCMQKQ